MHNQFLRVFCEVPCLPSKYYHHFNMLQTFSKKYLATLSSEVCIVHWMQGGTVCDPGHSFISGRSQLHLGGYFSMWAMENLTTIKGLWLCNEQKLIQNQCVVIPRCCTHVVLYSFTVDVVLNVQPAHLIQCELSCCTTQTTSICTTRLVWGYCMQWIAVLCAPYFLRL